MKKKKKINLTINKNVVSKIQQLTTNKSRLIELILLDYLTKNGIETNDIILSQMKKQNYLLIKQEKFMDIDMIIHQLIIKIIIVRLK